MGKLKALFGLKKQRHVEPPAEVKSSNSPSIVARLMGLDMLPEPATQAKSSDNKPVSLGNRVQPDSNTLADITASRDQLNGVTSRRKSKSFDESTVTKLSPVKVAAVRSPADQRHNNRQFRDDLELRTAPSPQQAESLQLEEMNRQLVSKHLQVLEELNAAKAQLTPRQGRGLSDSSEFQDAVDLLHANKHLFEKYLQSSGSVGKVSTKGEAVRKQDMQDQRESKMKTAGRIPQYLSGQSSPRPPLRPEPDGDTGSTIVVLKPSRNSQQGQFVRKEPAAKPHEKHGQRKHTAKSIAKKIKDSITKEVAKKFYSNVDSTAAAPQKGSPRRRKHSPEHSAVVEKKSSEAFPRAAKPSQPVHQGSKKSSVLKRQEKQVPDKTKTGTAAGKTSRKGVENSTSKTSREALAISKESQSNTKPRNVTVHRAEDDVSSEVSRSPSGAEFKSPTKSVKVASDVASENKSSPVSVLEAIDEEEIDDFIVELAGTAVSARKSKREQAVEEQLICPRGREEDFNYLKKLVSASTNNGCMHFPDPSLFESLEEDYNKETSLSTGDEDVEKAHSQAVKRWLIFDFVSDTLSNQSWHCQAKRYVRTSEQVLKELWSSLCQLYRLQSPDQSLQTLVGNEFPKDRNNQEDVSDICRQIENAILNDLIDDTVSKLV